MTTVTMHDERFPAGESPSQAIIKAASSVATVTDEKGRSIGIRRMNALDRLRMFEVVGNENAKNEAYLGYATLAFHVASIDGDPVSRPGSKLQLEGLVQRLDDEGLAAVALGIAEHFAVGEVGEIRDAAKNG